MLFLFCQAISYPYPDSFYGGAMAAYGSHAIVSDLLRIQPVLSLISPTFFCYFLVAACHFICLLGNVVDVPFWGLLLGRFCACMCALSLML
jgi:hypothetical protein